MDVSNDTDDHSSTQSDANKVIYSDDEETDYLVRQLLALRVKNVQWKNAFKWWIVEYPARKEKIFFPNAYGDALLAFKAAVSYLYQYRLKEINDIKKKKDRLIERIEDGEVGMRIPQTTGVTYQRERDFWISQFRVKWSNVSFSFAFNCSASSYERAWALAFSALMKSFVMRFIIEMQLIMDYVANVEQFMAQKVKVELKTEEPYVIGDSVIIKEEVFEYPESLRRRRASAGETEVVSSSDERPTKQRRYSTPAPSPMNMDDDIGRPRRSATVYSKVYGGLDYSSDDHSDGNDSNYDVTED